MYTWLKLTFGIKHSRNVEILFGDIKSQVEIFQRIVLRKERKKINEHVVIWKTLTRGFPDLGQLGVVEQVRPMPVDEGAEGETVPPAEMEVLDVDVLVGSRLSLAPQ